MCSQSSRHVGNPHHLALLTWNKPLAYQIEIRDPIDLVVISDAAVAIAKAELRPHGELDIFTAQLCGTMERAPCGPTVARKRPGDFLPGLALRRGVLVARD